MRIYVGADHGGYNLKETMKERLAGAGHEVTDVGTDSATSTDYPSYAAQVAKAVAGGQADMGLLICGSGVGMSVTANRFKGVRAVLAPTVEHARLGRAHNNGNVLCLGERLTPAELAFDILDVFLSTEFEGGRHQRRVDLIDSVCGE